MFVIVCFGVLPLRLIFKALSREDLEINECHQFVLLDVIRTKTPLNIALLNSQDSSVVGTYIERLWAIGQSFDLLDSNIEHLFIGVVITDIEHLFIGVVITEYNPGFYTL